MSPGQQKAMQSMAVLRGDSTNLPKSGFWGAFLDAADSPPAHRETDRQLCQRILAKHGYTVTVLENRRLMGEPRHEGPYHSTFQPLLALSTFDFRDKMHYVCRLC